MQTGLLNVNIFYKNLDYQESKPFMWFITFLRIKFKKYLSREILRHYNNICTQFENVLQILKHYNVEVYKLLHLTTKAKAGSI